MPYVRDDREAPLLWERDGGSSKAELPDGASGIFFAEGLDRLMRDLPVGHAADEFAIARNDSDEAIHACLAKSCSASRNTVAFPPPCGGGLGRGVAATAARVATPLPLSPQGGREPTTRAAPARYRFASMCAALALSKSSSYPRKRVSSTPRLLASIHPSLEYWIPAFAGMTASDAQRRKVHHEPLERSAG